MNLTHHAADFCSDAEWHFFATSHGKGPCDGVGGTVKRLAARASLQRPYENQIMEPKQLYEWAKSSLEGIHWSYVTTKEVEREEMLLRSRFASSITIPATQNYHAFHLIADEPARVMLCIFISLNILT